MNHATAQHFRVDDEKPSGAVRHATGRGRVERAVTGVRDDVAAPTGGAVRRPSAEDVFISEPLGCARQARYLVVQVTPRSLRLYRTSALWIAMEVRNAWRRGDFKVDAGDARLLPGPPPRAGKA